MLAQALFDMSLSWMLHLTVPGGDCMDASPVFVFVLKLIRTLRSGALCVTPIKHDPGLLPSILPVPANTCCPQMKRYGAVGAFVTTCINTRFEGSSLSSRQTLKAVTLKLHVAVLPDASVAVHVTVVVPTGNGVPEGGTHATVTPGQLSVATGSAKVPTAAVAIGQLAGATAVTLVGQVMVGGCVSLTVTVNEQVRGGGPVVVQVTVVVPTGKNEPDAGEQVGAAQLPSVVGGG